MITGVHHIGIAVKDLDEAVAKYTGVLGTALQSTHDVPETGTRLAFLSAGNTRLELLAPARPDGRIAQFIASHGEGMHHICLEVDDIQRALDFLSARGGIAEGQGTTPITHHRQDRLPAARGYERRHH